MRSMAIQFLSLQATTPRQGTDSSRLGNTTPAADGGRERRQTVLDAENYTSPALGYILRATSRLLTSFSEETQAYCDVCPGASTSQPEFLSPEASAAMVAMWKIKIATSMAAGA